MSVPIRTSASGVPGAVPSTRARPEVGRTSPASIRNVVVLPAPVRAEEPVHLTPADPEAERIDGKAVTLALGESLGRDRVRDHRLGVRSGASARTSRVANSTEWVMHPR
jgi:hypothetical protein